MAGKNGLSFPTEAEPRPRAPSLPYPQARRAPYPVALITKPASA